MCPDWESNPKPFVYGTLLQLTEPHRPGQQVLFLNRKLRMVSVYRQDYGGGLVSEWQLGKFEGKVSS